MGVEVCRKRVALPKLTRIHFGSYACFTSPSLILEKLPELSELVTYDFALFVCSSVKAIGGSGGVW